MSNLFFSNSFPSTVSLYIFTCCFLEIFHPFLFSALYSPCFPALFLGSKVSHLPLVSSSCPLFLKALSWVFHSSCWTPQAWRLFPFSWLQAHGADDSDVQLTSCPLLKVYSHISVTGHGSFSLESLPIVSYSTASNWAHHLPHKTSSLSKFLVSAMAPLSQLFWLKTLKSSLMIALSASLLAHSLSPSCLIIIKSYLFHPQTSLTLSPFHFLIWIFIQSGLSLITFSLPTCLTLDSHILIWSNMLNW